jgi:hypothetical protein
MKFTIDTKDIGSRILSAIRLTTESEAKQRAHRAFEMAHNDFSGNDDPASGDIAKGGFGYRRVTTKGLRDFTKMTHDQIIDVVWTLFQSNPLAKRDLQIKRDFILGRGLSVQTDDEDLQAVIDEFWKKLKFSKQLKKFVLQKHLWGEQIFPVFVRQTDGAVRLGYIDPGMVEHVSTHPHNSMEPWAVVLKKSQDEKVKIYRIIREDEGHLENGEVIQPVTPDKLLLAQQTQLAPWELIFLAANGLSEYTGDCFYFSINNVSNQPRGYSDLLQVADFMDAHDDTLFGLAEREQLAAYFAWFVKLIGASPEKVAERAKAGRKNPPRRGSVNYANENEEWTMATPDLKQEGSVATVTALQEHVLGGEGYPSHWYANGSETNRSTAEEQGAPTFKTLETWQDDTADDIKEILQFVADQAEIAGIWTPGEDDATINVIMPEMLKRDMVKVSTAMQQLFNALLVAKDQLKVLSRETVSKAVAKTMLELGIEYDPIEELEKVDAEAEQAAPVIQPLALPAMNGNGNGVQPAELEALELPLVTRWRMAGYDVEQLKRDAIYEDEYGIVEPFKVRQ